MLTIYSKETTSFTSLGLGALRDFLTAPIITEELNGAYTLEFKYAKDGYLAEYLVEQNIIKANGQLFRIWNIKKDMDGTTILAKHIFFDLTYNYLDDVAPTNKNAQDAISWLLSHAETATSFTCTGDCIDTFTARYVRKNLIDAIYNEDNAILKRFGGELEFDNYSVYVHAKRGQNASFSIRYKKNLTGIDFNLDFSNVATRIIPVGFDGITINGLYVTSPNESNYFTPLYKNYEFNNIKYDPDDAEAYQTLEDAQQALTDAANELFDKGADKPQISIDVDFVELSKCTEYQSYSNLESVHLGDTIDVIIPELNITEQVRVTKTVYNCFLDRFTSLELGSAMPSITTSTIILQQQVTQQSGFLDEAQENAKELINHPFKGNFYIDKTTGTIYLMDSNDPATAQDVWKWSLGGLGFSSTGINGTYTTAITQDGSIVANFITTGELSAQRISGGTLDLTGNNITISSDNFNVDINGNLTCSNADISGEITASSGAIGGYTISKSQNTNYIAAQAYPHYNFDIYDYLKVKNYLDGQGTLTPAEEIMYDIDGDGQVTEIDMQFIYRMVELHIDTGQGIHVQLMSNPGELNMNGFSVLAGFMTVFAASPMWGVTVDNGRVWGERILYDSGAVSGETGTVTLFDQIDDDLGLIFDIGSYKYIEIFGVDNNLQLGAYMKITKALANGDSFTLSMEEATSNGTYIRRTKYTISGADDNELVPSNYGYVYINNNGSVSTSQSQNYIQITKVVGWK